MAPKQFFYAVAVGRQLGVYLTWSECEAQVKGYPAAVFKRFSTMEDAQEFIATNRAAPATATPASASHGDGQRPMSAMIPPATWPPLPPALPAVRQPPPPPVPPPLPAMRVQPAPPVWPAAPAVWLLPPPPVSPAAPAVWLPPPPPVLPDVPALRGRPQPPTMWVPPAPPVLPAVRVQPAPPVLPDTMAEAGHWYYAVAKGRRPGIYDSWAEAEAQVRDLYSSKYKKFRSRAEGEQYVRDYAALKAPHRGDPSPKDPSSLVAFCDGSAIGNGLPGCRAGWACVFPHNRDWDEAGPLVGWLQSNNRAEYSAAVAAMRRANLQDPSAARPLFIFTDSMLLVRSIQEWLPTWRENGWVKADGSKAKNSDLLKLIHAAQGKRRVVWRHVKAHTGRKDWLSRWNDVADAQAKKAAHRR